MKTTLDTIAGYADELKFSDLSVEAVRHCKRCTIDAFGVGLGAFDEEPSRIARALAKRVSVPSGVRILGTGHRTLPELGAFANGIMIRYFDGNDVYPGGGGHPSDMIAAVLAAADLKNADGKAIVTAIVLAYEIYYALWQATHMRLKGMDNTYYTAVGGAAGAAKIMGLDRARIAEAVAIAAAANVAVDGTRYGRLSMWKGGAGPDAARNGMFAALLAEAGMTGPEKVFEGKHGLENLVGAFKLAPFGGGGRPFRITEVTIKYFLSEGHSQAPVTAALQLLRDTAAEDIEAVTIHTYKFAYEVIGSGAEKWRPVTREDADHSMPYIVASVLADGKFNDDIFSSGRLRDPRTMDLIDRIVIREDPALTQAAAGDKLPCRMEVRTRDGATRTIAVDYPRGHHLNPMSDEEIEDKFRGVARRALDEARMRRALDALWKLDTAPNLDAIFDAVRIGE
jgi:2-methylcitrate dehydratase